MTLSSAPEDLGADRPALAGAAEALDWVRLLAEEVGPRRPTSARERLAAERLVEGLRSRGVKARLEEFRGYASFSAPFATLMGLAIAPSLLPPRNRLLRSALALLSGIGLLSEGSLRITPLSRAMSRRPSQNVVAEIEPAGEAERTLCILAHLDSSRSGLIFHPRLVGYLGRWITANSATVAVAAVLEPAIGGSRPGRRLLGAARAALALSLGLLVERELRGVDVAGANDNASGCGVVAALATEVARSPLASTRLVVLITGCEEAGTLGARAFLDAHDTAGWLFLNFDNVGGEGTLRYLRREGVIAHWDADPGLIAAAKGVAGSRSELRMEHEDRPAGLTYDASPVLAAGGRALTLSIQDGSIPNLHWPTDTMENLSVDGVRRALEAGRAMLLAIDSGSADQAPAGDSSASPA